MGLLAGDVVYLSVRRHLAATQLPRPYFSSLDHFAADTLLPVRFVNEPTFQVAYVLRITVLGLRPDTGLEEAGQTAIAEVRDRHELRTGVLNDPDHLAAVFIDR